MEAVKGRRWEERRPSSSQLSAEHLSSLLGILPGTASVLLLRGISSVEEGRSFLDNRLASLPDPFLFDGMDRAVDRLVEAIEKDEKIAVHGDYDVDGITGTALLVEALRAFGADVSYYIPLRLLDGYGLSSDALRKAADEGARVAVSVDCGISAVKEAQKAIELGLDLIITDHHLPPEQLPEALAVINPRKAACSFPFKELAGVGVAFFLLVALRKGLRERGLFKSKGEPDLRVFLDLVALGTIADIVPLRGVNRILTKYGLDIMTAGNRPGIRALKEVADVSPEVSCGVVAFRLAPRLNAAGRLEDAARGVALLLESSEEETRPVARLLDELNKERQKIEQETLEQAVALIDEQNRLGRFSIVLADNRWHPGVIGIVASRLVERYHRPTILIALDGDAGKGSGRSIRGFHLYEALDQCCGYLEAFGGHEYAAGLSVKTDSIEHFSASFETIAAQRLTEEDLLPILAHDGEVSIEEITLEFITELLRLSPFGAGNPEPCFVARGIYAQQTKVLQEKHISFTARQGGYSAPCIAFGMADRLSDLSGEIDILFAPAINEWKGKRSIQLRIKDLRPAESAD